MSFGTIELRACVSGRNSIAGLWLKLKRNHPKLTLGWIFEPSFLLWGHSSPVSRRGHNPCFTPFVPISIRRLDTNFCQARKLGTMDGAPGVFECSSHQSDCFLSDLTSQEIMPIGYWNSASTVRITCCRFRNDKNSKTIGRLIFIHHQCWEVLPFCRFQRQRCIKIRVLRAQDFCTLLVLKTSKGQRLPALVV